MTVRPHGLQSLRDHAPATALALLAVLVPLLALDRCFDPVVMPRLATTTLLTGAALVAAGLTGSLMVTHPGLRLPAIALGALVAASALATTTGVGPRGALLGEFQRYQGLLPLVMYALLAIAAAGAARRPGGIDFVLAGLLIGAAISALHAILESAGFPWRSVGLSGWLVPAQLSPWELGEVCAAAAFLSVTPGEVAGDAPAAELV